jgi:hypothetical protein
MDFVLVMLDTIFRIISVLHVIQDALHAQTQTHVHLVLIHILLLVEYVAQVSVLPVIGQSATLVLVDIF